MWTVFTRGVAMTSQLALEEESQGIPPLVWVILVAVLIALGIWWWLRRPSEHDSHGAASHDQAHAKANHPVQPAAHTTESHPPAAKAAPPTAAQPHPASPVPPPAPAKPDDLTVLEGIGPKINTILQEVGIKTFKQLAETPVGRLQELMLQANLRIADPTTWPEQAALAAAGKMDELQKLQDSLKGGRKA